MLTFLFHLYSVVISLKNIDHEKKNLDTLGDIYLIQSNEFTCNCTHFKKYLHTLVKVENIFKACALEIKYFSNSQTIQRCFDIKIVTVISLIPTVCTIE